MKKYLFIAVLYIWTGLSFADNFNQLASDVIDKAFDNEKIKGTGHFFYIVTECDKNHIEGISKNLTPGKIETYIYDFTFVINTKDKSKAKINNSMLSQAVQKCIIETYYKEVKFFYYDWVPEVMNDRILFPVVIGSNNRFMIPETPIGMVGPE